MESPKRATAREFARLVAKEMEVNNSRTTDRWLKAIAKVVMDELNLCGEVTLPDIGTFKLKEYGGHTMKVPQPDGSRMEIFVDTRYRVMFSPSRAIKAVVNGDRDFIARRDKRMSYGKKFEELGELEAAEVEKIRRKKSMKERARKLDKENWK